MPVIRKLYTLIKWLSVLGLGLLDLYKRQIRPVKRRLGQSLRRLTPWGILITFSLGLALSIIYLPAAKVIGIFLLPVLLWLMFAYTDIALFVILLLVASFVDEAQIPRPFEVGGMGFFFSEFLLIVTACITFIKVHFDRKKSAYIRSPITLPLLLLMSCVILSLSVSYVEWLAKPSGPFRFREMYNWARPMLYLLVFFIAAYSLDTEKKLRRMITLLLVLSVVVSALIIAQQVVGYEHPIVSQSFYRGSGDNPGEVAASSGEVRLRVEVPGLHMMLALLPLTFALPALLRFKRGMWYFYALVFMAVALVVTWQRNYWICMFLELFVLTLALPKRVQWKLALIAFVSLGIASAGYIGVDTISSGGKGTKDMVARVESMFTPSKTMRTETIRWRVKENREALKSIRANPIFGVGVGNPIFYAKYRISGGRYVGEARYRMHNSYLMLYAYYGLPGLICCAWLAISFFLRAIALIRRTKSAFIRVLLISFIATFIGFLFRAFFNQLPADKGALAVMGLMFGVTESCWRIMLHNEARSSSDQRSGSCQLSPWSAGRRQQTVNVEGHFE